MRASGKFWGYTSRSCAALLTAAGSMVALCGFAPAGAQTRPGIVVSTSTAVGTIANGGALSGQSNAGITFAVNSVTGDAFIPTTYGNSILDYSPSKGTVTTLGPAGNAGGVAVDSANNLYITNLYGNQIIKLPFVSGAYVALTATTSSTPTCTGTDTVECVLPTTGYQTYNGSSGYFGINSIAFDPSGNLFAAIDGAAASPFTIFECSVACQKTGAAATTIYVEPTATSPTTTGQLQVGGMVFDASGNLFFNDSALLSSGASVSSSLKELVLTGTTYATTPTTIYTLTPATASISDDQIDGVAIDANYVYFVTQYDGIYGFPNVKGVVAPANIFAVTTQGSKSMGSDGKGNFYLDYNNGTETVGKISAQTLNAGLVR